MCAKETTVVYFGGFNSSDGKERGSDGKEQSTDGGCKKISNNDTMPFGQAYLFDTDMDG